MAKTKPMVKIHNSQTGEIIEREMNDAEFAQYEIDKTANDARLAEGQANLNAKSALLEKLGITAEEAALLLS